MGVPFEVAEKGLFEAVNELFANDFRVRAVGITRHEKAFGYRVVRNIALPVAFRAAPSLGAVNGVPVTYADALDETRAHVRIPIPPPVVALATGTPAEQGQHRPLVCGLQIQNFDDDVRTGVIEHGGIVIGTLGCFVRSEETSLVNLLSNNHVIAGENRGVKAADRILQPGSGTFVVAQHVATLTDFVPLSWSPLGAHPTLGTVVWNDVDAAIAEVETAAGIGWQNEFLPVNGLPGLAGTDSVAVGDDIFKVGRTTGLTRGTVTSIATVVGPVGYGAQQAWFRNSIEIVGTDTGPFSSPKFPDQVDVSVRQRGQSGRVDGAVLTTSERTPRATRTRAAAGAWAW